MNADKRDVFSGKHADVTEEIIQAFFAVHNKLGYGFSEKVYQNSLELELKKLGLEIEPQKKISNRKIHPYRVEVGLQRTATSHCCSSSLRQRRGL